MQSNESGPPPIPTEVEQTTQTPPRSPSRARLSFLAIASFSVSIFGCCVSPAAIAALILGFVAIERIRRSQGTMRGRNFAITGMVLGGVGLVSSLALQNFALSTLDGYETEIRKSVSTLLMDPDAEVATFTAATSEVAIFAVGTPGVNAEDRASFARSVRDRYGAFESLSIVSTEPIGSIFEPSFNWEVMFRFAEGKLIPGSVKTKLFPEIGSMMPVSRLTKVRLDVGDAVSLQLPAQQATEPTKEKLPESDDSGSVKD